MRPHLYNKVRIGHRYASVTPLQWTLHCAHTPGHPKVCSVARGYPPEGEAVWRSCGPEEDGVVRASDWPGRLEEAIEKEDRIDKQRE